jgi:hypothetical protein
MLQSILDAMDQVGQRLTDTQTDAIGDLQRVTFSFSATKRQHNRLCADIGGRPNIDKLRTFRDPEDD